MRVLYVSHTAEVSGGERSLLDLLRVLREDVQAAVATPPGDLQRAIAQLGIETVPITGTAGSLRLHPAHTPRALAQLAAAAAQVRRAARRYGAQVAHANSIRAGIMLALARPPKLARVVHVRDCLPPGALTTATMRLIGASADMLIANSSYTAEWIRASAPGARVRVIHNAVDLERFDPARLDRATTRASLGVAAERALVLGVVAQLTPWKGQDTAIRALRLLCDEGLDAHLLLVGSAKFRDPATRFDNDAYVARLHELVASSGLQERVSFLGEREDVPELISALDLLLLPSSQEPFGRALIEAMALRVPVIATAVGGPREIISDGVEGILAAPGQASAWARAIRTLADDPALRARMGEAGRATVEQRFSLAGHLAQVLDAYAQARRPLARR